MMIIRKRKRELMLFGNQAVEMSPELKEALMRLRELPWENGKVYLLTEQGFVKK